jgi:hypothetical protein
VSISDNNDNNGEKEFERASVCVKKEERRGERGERSSVFRANYPDKLNSSSTLVGLIMEHLLYVLLFSNYGSWCERTHQKTPSLRYFAGMYSNGM